MYSYEERMQAVKLLIKYDKCYAQVMRELGYPDRKSLMAWYKQYLSNGDLIKECERKAKFSEEEKHRAVNHYLEHGKCVRRTTRILGYPSRPTLDKWILELAPAQKKYCRSGNALIKYTREQKEAAVIALCSREKSAREVANEIGITRERLYSWKNQLLKKGWNRTMPKKDKVSQKVKTNISDDQAKLLLKEKDVLSKQVEELKIDKGISIKTLSNSEKAMVINALRENYLLKDLLIILNMAKSSYSYQDLVLSKEDKYFSLRNIIKEVFIESSKRYGYRRIHSVIKTTINTRH